jgi:hypothetical protein
MYASNVVKPEEYLHVMDVKSPFVDNTLLHIDKSSHINLMLLAKSMIFYGENKNGSRKSSY